jgi:hypothetical protein
MQPEDASANSNTCRDGTLSQLGNGLLAPDPTLTDQPP